MYNSQAGKWMDWTGQMETFWASALWLPPFSIDHVTLDEESRGCMQ